MFGKCGKSRTGPALPHPSWQDDADLTLLSLKFPIWKMEIRTSNSEDDREMKPESLWVCK